MPLLRVLAEARPGHWPAAERIARRYGRDLGGGPVRVVAHPVGAAELERLQRLGAGLLGPKFSAADLLADVTSTHVQEHHTAAGPGAAGNG